MKPKLFLSAGLLVAGMAISACGANDNTTDPVNDTTGAVVPTEAPLDAANPEATNPRR